MMAELRSQRAETAARMPVAEIVPNTQPRSLTTLLGRMAARLVFRRWATLVANNAESLLEAVAGSPLDALPAT